MDVSEYSRYGRQMIVPGIGLPGQLALKKSKVLVIGAGGLGCPAIAYLAGCGIGTLGIVDPDTVETSNLHRQILHNEPGMHKADSAAKYVSKLNPNVKIKVWNVALTPQNAIEIVKQFDVVVDCTDSAMSRYLVNDAAVLCNKPLVSASALKTEGQLAVYHYGSEGPCYRCLFPVAPPPQLMGNCGENGIIGPVVGIMGVHQAIETIKVVLNHEIIPTLTLFSMFSFPQWKQMKIRKRKADCSVCGTAPSITSLHDYDYVSFCGLNIAQSQHAVDKRIRAGELSAKLKNEAGTLMDVRPALQFEMCSIPEAINVPIDQLRRMKNASSLPFDTNKPVTVVCRYGNDSQEAATKLCEWGLDAYDVIGGLNSWSDIDPKFPRY